MNKRDSLNKKNWLYDPYLSVHHSRDAQPSEININIKNNLLM